MRAHVPAVSARFLAHAAVIGAVFALAGYYHATASTMAATSSSHSALTTTGPQDRGTTLTAGAILARNVDTLIQPDVEKKATESSNQIALATAGDNFLAKAQPLTTAGSPTRDINHYTVANGDTLSGIAQKFNITSSTILWANSIADEASIKPGQDLVILPVTGVLYTVAAGDTPAAIAAKYQANPALIESYNNLSGDPLTAGTKLILPDGVVPAAPKAAAAKPSLLTNAFSNAPRINFRSGANSYAYGYCTWYVASRRNVPNNWGNASSWFSNARADGYGTGSNPVPGAIAWENGNHVAYVESASGGNVTVSEMNFWGGGGGWGRVSYRTTSASHFRYIY